MSITNRTNLIEIIKAFPEYGKYIGYRPVTDGHINDTYVVKYEAEDGTILRYLLQRINVNVFKKPVELMENVCGVTSFLREKIKAEGGDPTRETLTVYPAKDGKNYFMADVLFGLILNWLFCFISLLYETNIYTHHLTRCACSDSAGATIIATHQRNRFWSPTR